MVKFVRIGSEYINPEHVETVARYGLKGVGIKLRSGEVTHVGERDMRDVIAILEGRAVDQEKMITSADLLDLVGRLDDIRADQTQTAIRQINAFLNQKTYMQKDAYNLLADVSRLLFDASKDAHLDDEQYNLLMAIAKDVRATRERHSEAGR